MNLFLLKKAKEKRVSSHEKKVGRRFIFQIESFDETEPEGARKP